MSTNNFNRLFFIASTAALSIALPQTTPTPLQVTRIYNITSTWTGECAAGIIDNRSQYVRQADYASFLATGSGTWTITMQYSNTSCSGPWTSFGSAAVVTQASSPAIGYGNGYHPYIKFAFAGANAATASLTYTAWKQAYVASSTGAVGFPVTIAQGGTSQTSVIDAKGSSGLNIPIVTSSDFTFSQTPGGSLIAGGVGQAITLTPCPLGLAGADTLHYVYFSGGTGTAEATLITGGTCTSGAASGTITVTPANAHSGAWTISSATFGLQEAQGTLGATGGEIRIPAGTYTIYGPFQKAAKAVWVRGAGAATNISVATGFSTSLSGVFRVDDTALDRYSVSGGFEDFEVECTEPDSITIGAYTQWPPIFNMTAFYKPEINRVTIKTCWDGVKAITGAGFSSYGMKMGTWGKAWNIDDTSDSVRIHDAHGWPFGGTANQITAYISDAGYFWYLGKLDDGHITDSASITSKCGNLHQGIASTALGLDGFITFSNLLCDSNGGLEVDGNRVRITGSFFSVGYGAASRYGQPAITQTGGSLLIGETEFYAASTLTGKIIDVNITHSLDTQSYTPGPGGDEVPNFSLSTSKFFNNGANTDYFRATTSSAYAGSVAVNLIGNQFYRLPSGSYTAYAINTADGTGSVRLTAIGNRAEPHLSGTSPFFNITDDGEHIISGNVAIGWSNTFPSSITRGSYWQNWVTSANTEANVVRVLGATATLNFAAAGAVPGCSADKTITVTGASPGDVVTVGPVYTIAAGVQLGQPWVSANDTVSLRFCQFSGAPIDPDGAGGTYRVSVWKY